MTDTDVDYGPEDPSDMILRDQRQTTSNVIASLEDDPEKASRAVELGRATGDHPSLIYSNLESYETQHKAALTSQLLNSSKFLRQYVDADPIHAKISNDDYGNLDNVSQRLIQSSLPGMVVGMNKSVFSGAVEGFKKGWENVTTAPHVTDEELRKYPLFTALMQSARFPVDVGGALISAATEAIKSGAETGYTAFTGDEMGAQRFGRELAAMAETVLTNTSGYHGIHAPSPAQLAKVHGILDKAKPWLDDNREPPRGLDPEIDKLKFEQNKLDLDNLDEALKASTQSATRERNPDIFADFVRQHTDAKIGISGDAVAKLYGEKIPEVEDNILGWSPGLKEELEIARATGGDVHIPLADWLAKVDPEVAKVLHDDIRVRPGGITKFEKDSFAEAKEGLEDYKPAQPLPEALPSIRASSALEPLFSIGDRKLELKRMSTANLKGDEQASAYAASVGANWDNLSEVQKNEYREDAKDINFQGRSAGFHDFDLLDENGNKTGSINLSEQQGGKQLYVEMIQGGPPGSKLYNPNSIGPALMRDLLRQLKAEFPEAETITGHRVSGAREKSGSYMEPSATPVIKLDADFTDPKITLDFQDLLQHGDWQHFGLGTEAYIKDLYQPEERKLIEAVNTTLKKIVPRGVEYQPAGDIRNVKIDKTITGSHIQYTDKNPIILWSLVANDAEGVAKHEAIHHLRQYGFFESGEWDTLTRAVRDNNWLEKYNINNRYPNLDNAAKIEEAVADGFRHWSQDAKLFSNKLYPIFEKLKQFIEQLKTKFKEILGKEPTWEELFGKVESGEVGSREGNAPLHPKAYRQALNVEEKPEFDKAAAIGMTVDQYKRYMKLIEKRHTEDLTSSLARAEAEQRKRQTKEWKANEKEVRSQVEENIQARPDIAADLFFGSGELYGQKIGKRPKLGEEFLTDEQKAKLPPEYIAKTGLDPDDVANVFGYGSGAALVDKLGEIHEAKTQLDMNTKDFVKRITDQEVDRQMEAKYGQLEKSILEEAKDQAISETQLDLLHEDVYALASKAGGEFSITKADMQKWIKDQTNRAPIGSIDTDKFLASAGKSGKAAEMALLKGNFAEAFREKQRQYLAMQMANEAKKLEKQIGQFDKQAKRLSARDQPNMEAAYVPFIHQILSQAGKPIRRSVQDLETALANVGKTLEEFVDEKQQHDLREVPVAAFLYDPAFRKKFEDLTVEEFRAVHDSIKALSQNARDELKIYKAGEAADLAEIKTKMIDELRTFKEVHYDASGGRWLLGVVPPKLAKVIRTYGAAHLQLESLFNRFDRGNPKGVFSQYVMRDLATSANYESALEKKYSRLLREVDDGAKLSNSVDNPIFYNPLSKSGGDQGYLMQFTRKNLRAILLNAGNESNLAKLAKGYDLTPEQVRGWLDQHATKEDWAWAQKIGNVFKEIKKEADTMYSGLTGGVEPEAIDIKLIKTPHGVQEGWYYPIIYHPEFEGASKKLMGGDALEEANFHRATTPAGYTKARTAYTAPMSLDLDMLPVRMRQMLHDIALRPAVINAGKIFYDKDVRAAIQKHYGNEFKELLIPYLKDVANSANFRDDASRTFANASEFIRQNMISTLIGLNPGTVMKHGPTAAINSMTEVGIGNFAKAMSSLMSINEKTGESNWKFAMETSEELQRRHRHYNETLSGATQSLVPTSKYMSMRESLIKFSSAPVAISDLLSAVPTWLAKYETAITEHGVHGDAVAEADRAVRRAHGSTAITNRSGVMRTGPMGAWMASVYGFFNHIMNRQYELMWKAGDTLGMVKEGDFKGAMKMTPELTVGLFSYVLLPALIEEMVTPLASDDHESWGKKAAKGIGYTLSASWIGVRDIASAMLRGQDPAVGLFSTSYKSFVDIARDLNKDKPLSKEHAGKLIQHGATVIGTASGLMNAQIGKAARYGYDISTGKERPKGPWSWMVGARFGTTDKHSKTFEEWLKHH